MNKEHTAGEIGRGAFWSMLNQLVGQVLSLFVFLVTARFVSQEDFGIMATCMLAVEFFRQFLIESLGTTIYSKKSPTDDDYTAGFFIIAACGTVSAAVVFLFAHPLAMLFDHPEISTALQWIAAILLTMGLSKMQEIWLTKHLRFKILAIRSIASILVGGGIGIYLAVTGHGIMALIAQQIITALMSLMWLWFASPWRPSFNIKWDNVRSIFNYWKFLAMNSLTSLVSGQSDVFFSSYYLGAASTGIYNAAKRILSAISMIISGGLNSVALPALTSFSLDKDRFRKSFLTCMSLTTFLTAPLFAGLIVLSADLIHILLGDKWDDVAPVLAVLAFSGFISSMTPYSVNVVLIEGKAHWQTALGIISAVTNVLLLILLAPLGLAAVAIGITLRIVAFAPVIIGLSLNLLNLKAMDYIRAVGLPILFAAIMAGVIAGAKHFIDMPHIVNLIIYVPFGALLYFSLFFFFDRRTLLEGITLLRQTIQKKSAPSL